MRFWMRLPLIVGALLLPTLLTGCGERLSPAASAARKALQFARPQEALDKLSGPPADATTEGHYLRACALEQLERVEAAKGEIQLALKAAPNNPKYRGYELRLKLFEGDESAIEPLLKLHDEHPSSAAVSLFAVFARQAKHVKQRSEGKLRAARVQLEKAQASLKTALALAAEIPECHRDLIGMAIWFEQPDDALKLIDAVLREEPDNLGFLEDRVKALLITKQPAETIAAGAALYRRKERTEAAAVEFANVLYRLPPSPAVLEQYALLREQFPSNTTILLRHTWTLGRAARVAEACEALEDAIDQQTDARRRRTLAQSSVAIPLEAGDVEMATKQLTKRRLEIGDELMIAYFEGEIAGLRKDYAKLVERMQEVVNLHRLDSTSSPDLARAALVRIRQVLSEQQLAEQVRKAAELTLRRAGMHRQDEAIIRDEARSLLNLLEAVEATPRPAFAPPESEAPRDADTPPDESLKK